MPVPLLLKQQILSGDQSPQSKTRPHFVLRSRLLPAVLLLSLAALSWLAMMIVHELGHVLHAWISGGGVTEVVLHPLAISRTDVEPNPRPHFVAWGGPVWGCALPVLALWIVRRLRFRWDHLAAFFAGFCLVANGAYLGSAVWLPAGDAEDLLRMGTPLWLLVVFGACTMAGGLWLWNGLGRRLGFGRDAEPVDPLHVAAVTLLLFVIVVLELALD